ncbi:MAG TPA: NAD-dependent epimerase/dehydratase family protein [Cellvibrionaceae bacterium]|nr:NAD-dependent epimerase/dehydratase family protein [Cellvibrionaceae bacterium]
MKIRLLVTGAGGFLGRSLAKYLPPDFEGIFLCSHGTNQGGHGNKDGIQIKLDLRDRASIGAVVREVKPTHVLNFASLGVTRDNSSLSELLAVNTVGALNIVDALNSEGVNAHIFQFGTAYEYADADMPLNEDSPLEPKSPYAISKTTLYYALKQYGAATPITFLRLFNVFGSGEPSERLIPFLVRKSLAGEEIPLTLGEQQRDFLYIKDLVSIIYRLVSLSTPVNQGLQVINIGTGQGIRLREFVNHVAKALNKYGISPKLNFGALPYREQDPMRCIADNSKLISLIGELSLTNLQVAVDYTVRDLYGK